MYERITPKDLLRQRSSEFTMQEQSVSAHHSNGEAVRAGHDTFTVRSRSCHFLY